MQFGAISDIFSAKKKKLCGSKHNELQYNVTGIQIKVPQKPDVSHFSMIFLKTICMD